MRAKTAMGIKYRAKQDRCLIFYEGLKNGLKFNKDWTYIHVELFMFKTLIKNIWLCLTFCDHNSVLNTLNTTKTVKSVMRDNDKALRPLTYLKTRSPMRNNPGDLFISGTSTCVSWNSQFNNFKRTWYSFWLHSTSTIQAESHSTKIKLFKNVVFDRHFGQVFVKIIETEAHEIVCDIPVGQVKVYYKKHQRTLLNSISII